MTLSEEIDKIIDNVEVDNKKFKSELLALFERKMNEVVPENNYFYRCPNFEMCKKCIEKSKQNIKKVLEGE